LPEKILGERQNQIKQSWLQEKQTILAYGSAAYRITKEVPLVDRMLKIVRVNMYYNTYTIDTSIKKEGTSRKSKNTFNAAPVKSCISNATKRPNPILSESNAT